MREMSISFGNAAEIQEHPLDNNSAMIQFMAVGQEQGALADTFCIGYCSDRFPCSGSMIKQRNREGL